MATNIKRPYSMDNMFATAVDPNNKTILDPYTFLWCEFPYYLRNSFSSVMTLTIQNAGAPDLVSWTQYGTHDYWWIISIANQMANPDTDMVSGINFYLPNAVDITNFLSQVNQRSQGSRLISLTS